MNKNEFRHRVWRKKGNFFAEEWSSSTDFYSLEASLDGQGNGIEDEEVDTLVDLYNLWRDRRKGDLACGEGDFKYYFYHHHIAVEKDHTGRQIYVDYCEEGKVYRRGQKVFFKPAGILGGKCERFK